MENNHEFKPVYLGTLSYAREHGEMELYHESTQLNNECAADIDKAISESRYDTHSYKLDSVFSEVVEKHGLERVGAVVAHTVNYHDFDGRLSTANKQWASTVETPKADYIPLKTHLAIFDGFTNRVKAAHQIMVREAEEKKEAIAELYSKALELDNLYFTDKDTGKIREWYFNPDSSHGGVIVENVLNFDTLIEVAKSTQTVNDFFTEFESECKQYNHDIDADGFAETLADLLGKQENKQYDFIGDNAETMNGLIDFAKEYNERILQENETPVDYSVWERDLADIEDDDLYHERRMELYKLQHPEETVQEPEASITEEREDEIRENFYAETNDPETQEWRDSLTADEQEYVDKLDGDFNKGFRKVVGEISRLIAKNPQITESESEVLYAANSIVDFLDNYATSPFGYENKEQFIETVSKDLAGDDKNVLRFYYDELNRVKSEYSGNRDIIKMANELISSLDGIQSAMPETAKTSADVIEVGKIDIEMANHTAEIYSAKAEISYGALDEMNSNSQQYRIEAVKLEVFSGNVQRITDACNNFYSENMTAEDSQVIMAAALKRDVNYNDIAAVKQALREAEDKAHGVMDGQPSEIPPETPETAGEINQTNKEEFSMKEITARVTPIEDGTKLKGNATVMLGDQMAIYGVKIVEGGQDGLFLSMPGEMKNKKFYETVLPASKEAHAKIKETVLAAYQDALKNGKQERSDLSPTDVSLEVDRFRDNPYNNNILGDCQVTVDKAFVIKGVKIIVTKEGGELSIAMPNKQDKFGENIPVAMPTSKEFFAQLKDEVLAGFKQYRASFIGNTPYKELTEGTQNSDLTYKTYNAEFVKNFLGEQLNADGVQWSGKIDGNKAKITIHKADEQKLENAVETAKEAGKTAKDAAKESTKEPAKDVKEKTAENAVETAPATRRKK